jgi:hypothetical protein
LNITDTSYLPDASRSPSKSLDLVAPTGGPVRPFRMVLLALGGSLCSAFAPTSLITSNKDLVQQEDEIRVLPIVRFATTSRRP